MVGSQIGDLTLAFLLAITCVSDVRIGHVSPFQTFTFQEISNNIRNASIQWILTHAIIFWRFGSPFGTPIPKMGVHLGMWGFTPSHSFALLGAWIVTPGLPSWPAPLQALALVASLRLGLRQYELEPINAYQEVTNVSFQIGHEWVEGILVEALEPILCVKGSRLKFSKTWIFIQFF